MRKVSDNQNFRPEGVPTAVEGKAVSNETQHSSSDDLLVEPLMMMHIFDEKKYVNSLKLVKIVRFSSGCFRVNVLCKIVTREPLLQYIWPCTLKS